MKQREIAGKQIISETYKTLSIDEMNPKIGDFLDDKYAVINKLKKLEMFVVKLGIQADSRGQDNNDSFLMDLLHDDLLSFAETVVHRKPSLLPYAGVIVGFVAQSTFSENNFKRIRQFFDMIEKKFDDLDADDVENIQHLKIETYYCIARMLPFESAFSQRLHRTVDDLLFESLLAGDGTYFAAIASLAAHAHEYRSGNSLLLANFESVMNDLRERNYAHEATQSSIVRNLDEILQFTGRVAANAPESSILTKRATRYFSKTWDTLLYMDKDCAVDTLRYFADACNTHPDINPRFVAVVQKKADLLNKAAAKTAESVGRTSPDTGTARQRLMGTTALSPALASPG